MSQKLKSLVLACSVTLLCIFGCQSGSTEPKATVGQVSGKVTFQSKPVADGEIVFVNEELRTEVVALLDQDGAYTANGIVQGKCKVFVRPATPPTPKDTMAPRPPVPNPTDIPKKYRSAKTSGLSLVVDADAKALDVDMTP